MGNNVHLLYDTRTWDAATVTASTSATGQGASRVLLDHPGKKWRSTSKTGNTLTFDLGSAVNATMLGIGNSGAAAFRLHNHQRPSVYVSQRGAAGR